MATQQKRDLPSGDDDDAARAVEDLLGSVETGDPHEEKLDRGP